ncbi:hypothetical protein ACSVDE_11930 [Pseudalkalibacillus sp. Hm43]
MTKTAEISVLTVFSGLFAGYALAIYPLERLVHKQSTRAKEMKIKYASQY